MDFERYKDVIDKIITLVDTMQEAIIYISDNLLPQMKYEEALLMLNDYVDAFEMIENVLNSASILNEKERDEINVDAENLKDIIKELINLYTIEQYNDLPLAYQIFSTKSRMWQEKVTGLLKSKMN